MERADNQAKDRDLVAGAASRSNRKVRAAKAAGAVPARENAGVAGADRAVARDAVAAKIVEQKPQQGGRYHARIR